MNAEAQVLKHARLVFTYIMIAMIARTSDDLGTHRINGPDLATAFRHKTFIVRKASKLC